MLRSTLYRTGVILLALMTAVLAACSPATPPEPSPLPPTETPTSAPTATPFIMPTAIPSQTPLPVTPSATIEEVDPLAGIVVEPPLTLDLPEGWQFGYDTLITRDLGEIIYLPFALYTGPVTDGTGTIVLLWNFLNATTGNPFSPAAGQPDPWLDGLRFLRTVIFENACVFGTAPRDDTYTVGGLPAVGTLFSVVTCPELPDTRGWFAALIVEEMNFVFYMYTDPISAMDGQAPYDLQAILDSITFRVNDWRIERLTQITPTPVSTP